MVVASEGENTMSKKLISILGAMLLAVPAVLAPVEAAGLKTHMSAVFGAKTPPGARSICGRYSWACARRSSGRIMDDKQVLKLAKQINSKVNRMIKGRSDRALYGVEERWVLPVNGAGDCEDYALMKKKMLIEAGVAPNKLLLTQVITRRGVPHVVLTVRTKRGDYMLDNLRSSVSHWRRTGHTVLKMQRPTNPARWDAILLGPRARRT